MSRQLPQSDVSRLNRLAAGEALRVDAWTGRVLESARRLARLSRGKFDAVKPVSGASWRDLVVKKERGRAAGYLVRKRRPLQISLDGIAKGFAVDQAVHALRKAGVRAALVNAGGDLRCFGDRAWAVSIRRPDAKNPRPAISLTVSNTALATSGSYFSSRFWKGPKPARRESWTVAAGTAMNADALTKFARQLEPKDIAVLRRLRASGWHLRSRGNDIEWQAIA